MSVSILHFFFLRIRRPPRSTRTDTLFPYTTLFRSDPTAAPILVAPRQPGREYDVDEHDGTLFIHTNDNDPMWRLVTAPIDNPGVWTERIAPSPHFYMTGMACFADYFVIEGREDGLEIGRASCRERVCQYV